MTKRRFWLSGVFGICFVAYLALYHASAERSFAAAISPEGKQSGYDTVVQTVFSFPFFHIDWIFTLPLSESVLTGACMTLNGIFWALVATLIIKIITIRWSELPPAGAAGSRSP